MGHEPWDLEQLDNRIERLMDLKQEYRTGKKYDYLDILFWQLLTQDERRHLLDPNINIRTLSCFVEMRNMQKGLEKDFTHGVAVCHDCADIEERMMQTDKPYDLRHFLQTEEVTDDG